MRVPKAKAVVLFVVAGMTAQAAEPATLMLACQGTVTPKNFRSSTEYDPDPISTGIVVNLTTRTLKGTTRWGPYLFDDQLQITDSNEHTVVFSGFSKFLGMTIHGSMDRVTGDLHMLATANAELFDYALKCRPAF
jgi:hypothetical protein